MPHVSVAPHVHGIGSSCPQIAAELEPVFAQKLQQQQQQHQDIELRLNETLDFDSFMIIVMKFCGENYATTKDIVDMKKLAQVQNHPLGAGWNIYVFPSPIFHPRPLI